MIEGVVVTPLKRINDPRGWLVELFRVDEWPVELHPAMAYVSLTLPGVIRGPHEHHEQADLFCFVSSTFKLRLWDKRAWSATLNAIDTYLTGEGNPLAVLVPSGVVHAYQNVGSTSGFVINCPNRLYAGWGHAAVVDEIRHEGNPAFSMEGE